MSRDLDKRYKGILIKLNTKKKMKTELNLTTPEGRKAALEALQNECKEAFIRNGINLSTQAVIRLSETVITISVYCQTEQKMVFASEVELYKREVGKYFDSELQLNYGSSGVFTAANKGAYWRTLHAAAILNNWYETTQIVKEYCKKYELLVEHIFSIPANQ